jgi:predicted transcriptional regulator
MDTQLMLVISSDLQARADALARRLGLTRSALFAEALADFLDLHGDPPGSGEDELPEGEPDAIF